MTQQLTLVADTPDPQGPCHQDAYTADELATIRAASALLRRQLNIHGPLTSPWETREYLATRVATLKNEAFGVMYLDNRHSVIAVEEVAHGSISRCSVHPRTVLQKCLRHNASAVILYHNHPSGTPEPSSADRRITEQLIDALKLVDIRVLDHFIVAPGAEAVSFSERGLV